MFCRLLQFTSIIFQPRRFGGSNLSTYLLSSEYKIWYDTLTCDGGLNDKIKVMKVLKKFVYLGWNWSCIFSNNNGNCFKKYFLSLPLFITKTKVMGGLKMWRCVDIYTSLDWSCIYSVFRTFTEDKVPTAAASYSLCIFFGYLQIHNLETMKNYVVSYSMDSFSCIYKYIIKQWSIIHFLYSMDSFLCINK